MTIAEDLQKYIQAHHKTHLIFDFDETIFQLLLPWEECLVFARKQLIELDAELLEKYPNYITRWSQLQNTFVEKHGKKAKEIIISNNTRFEMEMLEGVEVHHELVEFIKNTKKKHFFVWSSNTKPVIEKVLKEYGICERFEKIMTRTDVDFLKPHQEGFDNIYDGSIPKDRFLMVGDSISDEMGAKNVGIDFFRISYF